MPLTGTSEGRTLSGVVAKAPRASGPEWHSCPPCVLATDLGGLLWLQVVPESRRSSIYAFDRCFEGAISALAAPLVGLVAERWFHYTSNFHGSTPQQQLSNATALGDGLLVRTDVALVCIDFAQ